jgi:1,4-alpha-glucan branching enzyme
VYEHSDDKVIIFSRNSILFAFNFHPTRSYSDYSFEIQKGKYEMILDSDAGQFGGQGRLKPGQIHETFTMDDGNRRRSVLSLYLPTRTALVLRRVRNGS